MKKTLWFSVIFFLLGIGITLSLAASQDPTPEQVIKGLNDAVKRAELRGEYHCCIEPPCTMCYLGNWKFPAGTCHCDEAIAEGRDDDVCPQCKKGIDTGACESHAT